MANVLSELDLDRLRDTIDELRERKSRTLEELKKLEQQRNFYRDERDKLNKIASESFGKFKEARTSRDAANKRITELKETRKSVLEEMQGLIKEAKSIQTEIKDLKITRQEIKKSKRLRDRIQKLEWKLQITPGMDIKEERQLIEQINQLSDQLDQISVSEEKFHILKKLNSQIQNLRGFLDHSWKEFQELVEKSQKHHREMTEYYEEGKIAKEKADEMHEQFIKAAEKVRSLKKEFRQISKELREKSSIYKDNIKEKREKARMIRKEVNQAMLSAQAEKIQEKLSKTKKKTLSIEEMRIIMSQDPNILGFDEK